MSWIILAVLVLLIGWLISMFNGLVILKNRVDEAASDIDVQLKRRHDLVPNLINTVKGYATHEERLFTQVTEARSQAVSAGANMKDRAQAENMLTDVLRSLFAVAENYPQLRANENFLKLQEELADTENKIMASRRFYNANVRDYNTRRETIPTNLFASMFNFGKRELFELEDISEKEVPQVNFSAPATPASSVAPVEPAPTESASPAPAVNAEPAFSSDNPAAPTTDQPEAEKSETDPNQSAQS